MADETKLDDTLLSVKKSELTHPPATGVDDMISYVRSPHEASRQS
jgi:hypothetical protein